MEKIKLLCLDLDGTVRVTKSGKTFPENPSDQQLKSGMEDKIREYKGKGFAVIGITNQAGVAHGFKSESDVITENIITESLFKNGSPFEYIYYCPYDKEGIAFDRYNVRSLCRKPDIGMLVRAELAFNKRNIIVDWDNSVMVGDREEDAKCAANAGIKFIHVDNFLNDGESKQAELFQRNA